MRKDLYLKDSFVPLFSLHKNLNDLFENFFDIDNTKTTNENTRGFVADIYQKDDVYYIQAQLPGVSKEDIEIEETNSMIKVSTKNMKEVNDERQYYQSEIYKGSYERFFKLPDNADISKISAKYKNGVLELSIPKSEEAKPNKIEIL